MPATLPTLPQATVDTSYSLPTGQSHNPNTAAELSTLLGGGSLDGKTLALNDVVTLDAGTIYDGLFVLPNFTSGSGWIYIVSSALGSLPAEGTRVAPADEANMPTIRTSTSNTRALRCANTAHHFRFVGIKFLNSATTNQGTVIDWGANSSPSVEANAPHHLILDRCYVTNTGTTGRRGAIFNGADQAAVECYINNFKETSADTQAILFYNGRGPFKIHNNYLEATGENLLFGGASASVTNLLPSDITCTRNTIAKNPAWRTGTNHQVKNLVEFKFGTRALFEGNLFQWSWVDDQQGQIFVFTPRQQKGSVPWAEVSDITIRYNKAENINRFMNMTGDDHQGADEGAKRILAHDNLILVDRLTRGGNGGDGRICQFTAGNQQGCLDVAIKHNTFIITNGGGAMGFSDSGSFSHDRFDLTDNIWHGGTSGWAGTGSSEGNDVLNDHYTVNVDMDFNAILGRSSGNYPSGNFFPTFATMQGEFLDYQPDLTGDFRLNPSSIYAAGGSSDASDGADLGADIDAIEAAMAGASAETAAVSAIGAGALNAAGASNRGGASSMLGTSFMIGEGLGIPDEPQRTNTRMRSRL